MRAKGASRKAPVVMIHGAFCGPWSLDGLKRKFKEAGYAVTTPCLRFHDQKPPPAALGTTGLGEYAADLEDEIQALGTAPILVGHSMGGLLAQQLAARMEARALACWRLRRPGARRRPLCSRLAPPRRCISNPGYWNKVLEPNRDVALAHSLDKLPRTYALRGL